jgi:hypothetical protein
MNMKDKSYTKRDLATGASYDPMTAPRYTELATFMRAQLATRSRKSTSV